MNRRLLAFALYVPAVFVPTWLASCGDSDEAPNDPVDAATLDVTTGTDAATGSETSTGTDAGTDATLTDANTGTDAAQDAAPDVTTCPTLAFADGGPFLTPSPYLQRSDSPFAGCVFKSYFHLADFEGPDGGLPPGTTGTGAKYPGFGISSTIVDSVDGDDGFPNGPPPDAGVGATRCPGCQSYFGGSMDFSFDETVLGALPTHTGLVWTDDCNPCTVTLTAYHADGGVIGSQAVGGIGSSGISGETDEDRFFGLVWDAGVKRITMTHTGGGMEIDHLQIGR